MSDTTYLDGIAPYGDIPPAEPLKHKVRTTMITKKGEFLGWKVYIDGKKYPAKPRDYYENMLEYKALQLAFKEAGLNPDEIQDVIV